MALMRGEHNKKLKWPFRGTIIIQLMNWKVFEDHVKCTLVFHEIAAAYGSADRNFRRAFCKLMGLSSVHLSH